MSNSLRPHGLQHTRLPVHHQLPEFTQLLSIESVMPPNNLILCHPLFPPDFNLPQHQFLFQWVSTLATSGGQSIGASGSASVPPINIQGWFLLGLTGLISLLSNGFSRVFSSTTFQKPQFFCAQPFLWSNTHICTWLLEKPYLWLHGPLSAKWCLCFSICCLGWSWILGGHKHSDHSN